MSTTSKTILWIVVVIIVIGGIWWWMADHNTAVDQSAMSDMTPQQMQEMSSTPAPAANATSTSLPQGDSDQAIGQDMNSANAQMNGFSSDSANMNQSLNDQPVQQAE